MKLLTFLFLIFVTTFNSYAAICICAPSESDYFDEAEYDRCVAQIVPISSPRSEPDSHINCDSSNLRDSELAVCMATEALERAIENNYSLCSKLAKKQMIELLFLAEGQKITLGKFGAKEECSKKIKKLPECH